MAHFIHKEEDNDTIGRLTLNDLIKINTAKVNDIVPFGPYDWIVVRTDRRYIGLLCRQIISVLPFDWSKVDEYDKYDKNIISFYEATNEVIKDIFNSEELNLIFDMNENRLPIYETYKENGQKIKTKAFIPSEDVLSIIKKEELKSHYNDDLNLKGYESLYGESAQYYLAEDSTSLNSWWTMGKEGQLSVIDREGKHISHTKWEEEDVITKYEIRGFRPQIVLNNDYISKKILSLMQKKGSAC